tara:strand:- start:297 stop:476 length:180 start_codon:yes stop_codon:yes gene_type:complete
MKTTHGWKDLATKPIAKILPNGLIRYFNPDGSINVDHELGFYYPGAEQVLKNEGYDVYR